MLAASPFVTDAVGGILLQPSAKLKQFWATGFLFEVSERKFPGHWIYRWSSLEVWTSLSYSISRYCFLWAGTFSLNHWTLLHLLGSWYEENYFDGPARALEEQLFRHCELHYYKYSDSSASRNLMADDAVQHANHSCWGWWCWQSISRNWQGCLRAEESGNMNSRKSLASKTGRLVTLRFCCFSSDFARTSSLTCRSKSDCYTQGRCMRTLQQIAILPLLALPQG